MLRLLLDPGIFIVICTFIGMITFVVLKYRMVNAELIKLADFLEKFRKTDLNFRFKEFDMGMESNPYVEHVWKEFKNTLMFSETMSFGEDSNGMQMERLSDSIENIQCTVEPNFFFNEETLVTSRYNNKMVQIAPTLLTGLGPLFTFMHIGEAFSKVDFTSQENTVSSVGGLMTSMQAAAMVSVLAVGASLIFLLFEKILYNLLCKKTVAHVEELMSKLFDSISSEKFLIELLRENKKQNSITSSLLRNIPVEFSKAFDNSLNSILIPYLENVLYSLNKMQDKMELAAKNAKKSSSDAIDELF